MSSAELLRSNFWLSQFVIDAVMWKMSQSHWKRVLCILESTPVHFWHEYEKLFFLHIFALFVYDIHSICVK